MKIRLKFALVGRSDTLIMDIEIAKLDGEVFWQVHCEDSASLTFSYLRRFRFVALISESRMLYSDSVWVSV